MNHVTITFDSREDCAFFLGACLEQVTNRDRQIGNLTVGLMKSALSRATVVESNLTPEQAKAIRLGKSMPLTA